MALVVTVRPPTGRSADYEPRAPTRLIRSGSNCYSRRFGVAQSSRLTAGYAGRPTGADVSGQWVTVAGTLGGVTITAIAALISQHLQRKFQEEREISAARRETYGVFLTSANAYYAALTDLSWAVRNWHEGHGELMERTREVDRRRVEFISAKGRTDIITAKKSTKRAAAALSRRLKDIERQIFMIRRRTETPQERRRALPNEAGWDCIYAGPRDEFVRAAQAELKIDRAGSSRLALAEDVPEENGSLPQSTKLTLFTIPRKGYGERLCATPPSRDAPGKHITLTMDDKLLAWLRREVEDAYQVRGTSARGDKTWHVGQDGPWTTLTGPVLIYVDDFRKSNPQVALAWAIAIEARYLDSLRHAIL